MVIAYEESGERAIHRVLLSNGLGITKEPMLYSCKERRTVVARYPLDLKLALQKAAGFVLLDLAQAESVKIFLRQGMLAFEQFQQHSCLVERKTWT